jgi:uncharacterized phiE125 gp8 family phage protein
MPSILLTGPAAEPIALAEAKSFLRIEHDGDDDVIAALISGARIHVEAATRRALIAQTWRHVRDAWPADGRLKILPAPLREIVAARVYNSAGVAQDIDLQAFVADTTAAPGTIAFASWALPPPGRAVAGIEIDIETGYGDAASNIPDALRQAVRLLVAHWYENRGLTAIGHAVAVLPASVAALIAPYRVLAL